MHGQTNGGRDGPDLQDRWLPLDLLPVGKKQTTGMGRACVSPPQDPGRTPQGRSQATTIMAFDIRAAPTRPRAPASVGRRAQEGIHDDDEGARRYARQTKVKTVNHDGGAKGETVRLGEGSLQTTHATCRMVCPALAGQALARAERASTQASSSGRNENLRRRPHCWSKVEEGSGDSTGAWFVAHVFPLLAHTPGLEPRAAS